MNSEFVTVGDYALNLEQLTSVHWEKGKLFVHLAGGRFEKFEGDDAQRLWQRIKARDLGNAIDERELAGVGS